MILQFYPRRLLLFLLLTIGTLLFSQTFRNPLSIQPALSANFGELRNNHFHSGIDFKTQQTINKPVYAIADGYVSRISVAPGGYGLALYIDHPATGHTSVYGHLNSFSKPISDYVKKKQYELEQFRVNLYPEKGLLSVKQGEQIALSGNSGGSGGPHLHFEIRDKETEEPLDVLEFLPPIADTRKPDLRGIAFYPVEGKGIVNGHNTPQRITIRKDKNGNPLPLGTSITAWGRIGIGVKAYDRMNGQSNIYGVKHIRLYLDKELIYSSTIRRFSFEQTRMLNSFIDFADWRNRRSFFMKSFIEPGNKLPIYHTKNRGYIDINQERVYNFRYELEDHYGNHLSYSFRVMGVQGSIPKTDSSGYYMSYQFDNHYVLPNFSLSIPSGNLYQDIHFKHMVVKSDAHYSDIHQVHNQPIPLHKEGILRIQLKNDTLQQKSNYGIISINPNGNESWIGGTYSKGGINVRISELGERYAVSADTEAPSIIPYQQENWKSQRKIRLRVRDNKSGIVSFRGEINGRFVLFTHDIKSTIYTYQVDADRLPKEEPLELTFTVTDNAGNSSTYTTRLL